MEHLTAERSCPRPLSPLRLWRRRDGMPAPLVAHHYPSPVLEPSRSEARRRRLYLLGAWEAYRATLVPGLNCGERWSGVTTVDRC